MDFSKIKNKQLVISTEFDINNQRLKNVDTPIVDKDATNKKYVDDLTKATSVNYALGTGLYSGGETSLVNTTSFTVQSGIGYIVDPDDKSIVELQWALQTVTMIAVGVDDVTISFGIDSNGDVHQQIPKFTDLQRRSIISLGEISLDIVSSLLEAVIWYPVFSWDSSTDVDFYLADTNKNLEGNIVTANSTNLKLDISAGKIFGYSINAINSTENPNTTTLGLTTGFTFGTGYYNGGSWVYQQIVGDIAPAFWSNGTTNLQNAAADKFNLRVLYRGSVTGRMGVIYPTQNREFNSINDAERDVFNREIFIPDELVNLVIPCSYLIVKGNATDLSDPTQAKIVNISTLTNTAYGETTTDAIDILFDDTTSTLTGTGNVQDAIDLLDTNDFASSNVNMIALSGVTGTTYLATLSTVVDKPLTRIRVYLNSLEAEVGNATKTADCYFSSDSGTTPKAYNTVSIGDELYWNSAYDNMDLDITDLIDFVYMTR